jgi:tartrate dehydrogenase/decarboxylase/D-malate dehydrogenase
MDALAARVIQDPASIDVVVASNLFADILTDLAAAIAGGLGMAPSANVAPGSDAPGVFESVHGSAQTSPERAVLIRSPRSGVQGSCSSTSGKPRAPRPIRAFESVCAVGPKTPDVGGTATTDQVGDAILAAVESSSTTERTA